MVETLDPTVFEFHTDSWQYKAKNATNAEDKDQAAENNKAFDRFMSRATFIQPGMGSRGARQFRQRDDYEYLTAVGGMARAATWMEEVRRSDKETATAKQEILARRALEEGKERADDARAAWEQRRRDVDRLRRLHDSAEDTKERRKEVLEMLVASGKGYTSAVVTAKLVTKSPSVTPQIGKPVGKSQLPPTSPPPLAPLVPVLIPTLQSLDVSALEAEAEKLENRLEDLFLYRDSNADKIEAAAEKRGSAYDALEDLRASTSVSDQAKIPQAKDEYEQAEREFAQATRMDEFAAVNMALVSVYEKLLAIESANTDRLTREKDAAEKNVAEITARTTDELQRLEQEENARKATAATSLAAKATARDEAKEILDTATKDAREKDAAVETLKDALATLEAAIAEAERDKQQAVEAYDAFASAEPGKVEAFANAVSTAIDTKKAGLLTRIKYLEGQVRGYEADLLSATAMNDNLRVVTLEAAIKKDKEELEENRLLLSDNDTIRLDAQTAVGIDKPHKKAWEKLKKLQRATSAVTMSQKDLEDTRQRYEQKKIEKSQLEELNRSRQRAYDNADEEYETARSAKSAAAGEYNRKLDEAREAGATRLREGEEKVKRYADELARLEKYKGDLLGEVDSERQKRKKEFEKQLNDRIASIRAETDAAISTARAAEAAVVAKAQIDKDAGHITGAKFKNIETQEKSKFQKAESDANAKYSREFEEARLEIEAAKAVATRKETRKLRSITRNTGPGKIEPLPVAAKPTHFETKTIQKAPTKKGSKPIRGVPKKKQPREEHSLYSMAHLLEPMEETPLAARAEAGSGSISGFGSAAAAADDDDWIVPME